MRSNPENRSIADPGQGRQRYTHLIMLAAVSAAVMLILPRGLAVTGAAAAAATLLFMLAMTAFGDWLRSQRAANGIDLLTRMIARDPAAVIVTDRSGRIVTSNRAALSRFDIRAGEMLTGGLAGTFGNPARIVHRLLAAAETQDAGSVVEDVETSHPALRVAVHRPEPDRFFWRFDPLPAKNGPGQAENSPVPMVRAGRSGAILFMNDAARNLAGGRHKALKELFKTLPVRSNEVNRLRGASGDTDVMVVEQENTAGQRELFLLPAGPAQTQRIGGFEGLPVPVLKLTPGGRIISLNIQARTLLGDAAEGDLLFSLMTGLGRSLADWLRDMAMGRPVNHTEFLRLTRTDREMFVQVTLSRVAEDGETTVVAVMHDATELKTLEAQFVQTQKMQAIGQLAGGVAHDFNNLLTAISGHCDLLLLRHDQEDLDYADLIQIRQNANRAAALVSQLLAFSRKQTLRPEVLDLRDTLADLTHLLNRLVGEKVMLILVHDPVLKTIRADKRQLEQVLMNLVVNARDAMPSGGEIRIETEARTLDEPLRRDRARVPPGDYVLVRVIDQGVGIDPDKIQKVFEPFYTTKRTGEGTGLGLSTAYGIVKQTGGFIFVDSEPGQGTCFTLYLPVFDQIDALPEPEPVEAAAVTRQGDGVVLLVEDEAPVRAFASRALRLRGFTVLEAESAEDALELLSDSSVLVDVFVTDVVMPGMDGPTWVRKALKDRPDVRVVFVSGYAEGAFGDDGPEVPNSTFLPKPFSLSQLTETVNQQLQ